VFLSYEEISVKKILAVINATYAVAKRKPEKIFHGKIQITKLSDPIGTTTPKSFQYTITVSQIFSGFLFATA